MKTNHFVGALIIVLILVVTVMVYHPFGLRANESYITWTNKKGNIINAGDANASYSKAGTEGFQGAKNTLNTKLQRARGAKQGFQSGGTPIPKAPSIGKPSIPTSSPMQHVLPAVPTSMSNAVIPHPTSMSNAVIPPPNAAMMSNNVPLSMNNIVGSNAVVAGFQNLNQNETQGMNYRKDMKEGFTTMNYADIAGGAKDLYQPIGAFDGVTLSTGNKVSSWRFTAPDEPLLGAEFTPGDDSLFIFKNNQCKPECAGSSFSCSSGGVCTTPRQRSYINSRGGNRTIPGED